MSYSYLQAVFPKFEHSKIYDDKIYSSLDSISTDLTNSKNKIIKEKKEEPKPLTPENNNMTVLLEKFDQPKIRNEIDHQMYIKHILECNYCKDIIIKQYKLQDDKLFKEEMIELISFIAFGIFILMFLDKSKK
jgi:hypothetical protein